MSLRFWQQTFCPLFRNASGLHRPLQLLYQTNIAMKKSWLSITNYIFMIHVPTNLPYISIFLYCAWPGHFSLGKPVVYISTTKKTRLGRPNRMNRRRHHEVHPMTSEVRRVHKLFEDSEEQWVWAFFINPLPEFFQAIFWESKKLNQHLNLGWPFWDGVYPVFRGFFWSTPTPG